ncbi:MAG: response regulator [Alphaproteobacteria bacterium]|nr:response regulator [Alphaproteobacteria bacterium]
MDIQQFSARPHILVVDDDERIRDLVSRYLWENEFVVMEAADASAARDMLARYSFDALVVDVMMPGETGLEFTKGLKGDVPVLLLTALGEAQDRITGLEAGADDYLPKPFEPRELVLRLNAILRRTAKPQEALRPFKIGAWRFDPEMNEFRNGDAVLALTDMEKSLVRALAGRAGEPVSREALAEICGIDAGERTIDVQVTRLRRKIEEDTRNPRYLQTVRGKGYMLRVEDL